MRLTLAAVVIVIGAIAIGALRIFGPKAPPATLADASPAPIVTPSFAAPSPVAAADTSPIAAALTPTPVATPTATPTPEPNLLSMKYGAFVREWTAGGFTDSPERLVQDWADVITPGFPRPVTVVFELPSAAHIDRVSATLSADTPNGAKAIAIDVAAGENIHALQKIGSIDVTLPADSHAERPLNVGADARFVRFSVPPLSLAHVHVQVAAYGTPGAPQRGTLSGTWISADDISSSPRSVYNGVIGSVPDVPPKAAQNDPRATFEGGGQLSEFLCGSRLPVWRGAVTDNVARAPSEALQLAGNGNLLVGIADAHYILALRALRVKPPAACSPATLGRGPTVPALVLTAGEASSAGPLPEFDPARFPGYRFERRLAPLLESSQLEHAHFAVLADDCNATNDLLPSQQQVLLRWVAAGHKLIIRDSDLCKSSDYSFLPYRFKTVATGRLGARGSILELADPSTLGSGPNDRAHFLDTEAYLRGGQDIGDADLIQTDDPRWCGHLFSRNAKRANGWVHAYARYGRGLIIYDGFDEDDLWGRNPAALRLVQLEYAQPAEAELPCNARVASALVLTPSTYRSLPAGKPVTLRVPMTLAYASAQQATQGVTLSIAGDTHFRAGVSPVRVQLKPGPGSAVSATVELPSGWSGIHAFTVTAAGEEGQTAHATIVADGSVALAKAFESERRVRIYGIHFDVDSATIQPRSEDTIAQIAQVLDAHRDWKMRVEGHTDSDGGAGYNLALSVRRAHAVVADLVTRYRIAGNRLTSAGFGLTRPVAPNSTEAGKALNRRVELVRL